MNIFKLLSILIIACSCNSAYSATWCGPTQVTRAVCPQNDDCYAGADAFGGARYYKILSTDKNKSQQFALAMSSLLTGKTATFVFNADGLSCSDIPDGTEIYELILNSN